MLRLGKNYGEGEIVGGCAEGVGEPAREAGGEIANFWVWSALI